MTEPLLHQSSLSCRHVDCEGEATRYLEIPMMTPGLPAFRDWYCDAHADEILGDGFIWPGAKEVECA